MDSVTRIRMAWALRRKHIPVGEIAAEVGRDRLQQEGVKLSLSTSYRILNQHLTSLRKYTRTAKGEPAQRGEQAREVVQRDTLDLGALYAFTAIDT